MPIGTAQVVGVQCVLGGSAVLGRHLDSSGRRLENNEIQFLRITGPETISASTGYATGISYTLYVSSGAVC
jgi:hypothetical protein